MKQQYDSHASNTRFEKGDNVWLYTPQKKRGLSASYSGTGKDLIQ
jgi:hypothetical protein